ncbi:MAG TPA: sigma-54 dependent transcriptional regulator, partial [bacterium]|nr:sigma-54 dependent transcriptional regulator [bacterium]
GAGKEVVANTIHDLSPRSRRDFVAVNCGAVARELIESELFGHERGSFTGATKTRQGVFEQASGGTLFLDEITEMSPALQVRLLRVLETREVTRVGGENPLTVDVRVLAATNQRPEEAVRDGRLREDLYFRLNVFHLEVPPLRDRTGDCELLARHFLDELSRQRETPAPRLSEAAVRELEAHDWPGNVRELRNAIERAFVTSGDEIRPEHLGLRALSPNRPESGKLGIRTGMSIAEAEKRLILATLEDSGGDKKRCASTLGISLKTLYNRLNRYADDSSERKG